MRRIVLALAVVLLGWPIGAGRGEDWPQFRGLNGCARSTSSAPLPDEVGPEKNVAWKIELPPGISSPIVSGQQIFLTTERDERLFTVALDRATGRMLWEAEAPHQGLEKVHTIGSHAQSTPTADGDVVASFFGSCGLFVYDLGGKLLWKLPMGPFKNDFGAGSSPLLVGERLILCQDHDTDSFLMALDKRTGQMLWRVGRDEFPRGYATPVLWNNDGHTQIVVPGTLRIVAYDLETGAEAWTITGVARIVNMSPSVGPDGTLFIPTWSPGADQEDRIHVEPFEATIADADRNGNQALELDEVPDGPLKQRFDQIDRDKSGQITQVEYESMRRVFDEAKNVMVAVRPGGHGDITDTHVTWRYDRMLPYVPSPVLVDGYLFMVKNGGIVSCLDAATGKPAKQGRVSGTANYYASPVSGDGKVYLFSERGEATVLAAVPKWRELSTAQLGESIMATPAIADGRLYVRTAGHLYCFARPE
ncbi:MAG: PQQ-binding-like beta-propeller repeat protein [Pirellulales bacterium]|nr:PQQ-binding-like beta-propeller repeat protein [Pirellulales bacterium]